MTFLSVDAVVPVEWRTDDLWLRVLRPDGTLLRLESSANGQFVRVCRD